MKKSPLLPLAAVITLTLSGCANLGPSEIEITRLNTQTLEDAPLKPAKLMQTEQFNAIVMPPRITGIVTSIDDKTIASAVQGKIETTLASSGIKTIDRKMAKELADELALAEMNGRFNYKGPQVADFAIYSNVTEAGMSEVYKKATKNTSAGCHYHATLKGQIRIVSIPSMEPVGDADLNGSDREKHESRCNLKSGTRQTMLSAAAEDALLNAQDPIRNALAPKGYIIERRAKNSEDGLIDNVFRISLGMSAGAKTGGKVRILRKEVTQIDGKNYTDTNLIADAVVTQAVKSDTSWIYIEDPEIAQSIKKGDIAELYSETSAWEKLNLDLPIRL